MLCIQASRGLVLRLLSFVNDYFRLDLNAEMEARWTVFPKIWDGALVDPPTQGISWNTERSHKYY
jgi:hypothetical protein